MGLSVPFRFVLLEERQVQCNHNQLNTVDPGSQLPASFHISHPLLLPGDRMFDWILSFCIIFDCLNQQWLHGSTVQDVSEYIKKRIRKLYQLQRYNTNSSFTGYLRQILDGWVEVAFRAQHAIHRNEKKHFEHSVYENSHASNSGMIPFYSV